MARWMTALALTLMVGTTPALAEQGGPAPASERSTHQVVKVRSTGAAVIRADRRVLVQVEPHPDNRLLRLAIDAGDYYRSTDIQLDGKHAAKTHFVTWQAVPAAPYVLSATVYGSHGVRGQDVERRGGPEDNLQLPTAPTTK